MILCVDHRGYKCALHRREGNPSVLQLRFGFLFWTGFPWLRIIFRGRVCFFLSSAGWVDLPLIAFLLVASPRSSGCVRSGVFLFYPWFRCCEFLRAESKSKGAYLRFGSCAPCEYGRLSWAEA